MFMHYISTTEKKLGQLVLTIVHGQKYETPCKKLAINYEVL